ncbi:hypothetical protein [Streptomyces nigra]|uniref:hypothetical protein n=1 Tax=Streptomyces nigra TaxID=1827580 RepID=UPI0035DD1FE1
MLEAVGVGEVTVQVLDAGRLGDGDGLHGAAGELGGQAVHFGRGVVVVGDALRAVVLDAQQHQRRVGHVRYVEVAEAGVEGAVAYRAVHLNPVADPFAARYPPVVEEHRDGYEETQDGRADGDDVLEAQPLHRWSPATPRVQMVTSPYACPNRRSRPERQCSLDVQPSAGIL